jgi:hypothetical protein
MDITAHFAAACPVERLFAEVDDLAGYPSWLQIVDRAVPDPDDPAVWSVDLRGRLGPLARSKRLRMVRTERVAGERVRFERRELDGRQHSAWELEATVRAVTGGGSELEMRLHYGGSFGGAILERMLRDEIEHSRPRLEERLGR